MMESTTIIGNSSAERRSCLGSCTANLLQVLRRMIEGLRIVLLGDELELPSEEKQHSVFDRVALFAAQALIGLGQRLAAVGAGDLARDPARFFWLAWPRAA